MRLIQGESYNENIDGGVLLRLFDELKDTIKHFKCEPPGLRDITDNSIVDGAVHFQEYKCDCSPAGNQGRGCGMYLFESGCTCPLAVRVCGRLSSG